MNNKEIALKYLKHGLSVIPLVSPTMASEKYAGEELIRRCKIPPIKWKDYQERLPTINEVNEWWSRWPDANIGIVTGPVSGIVVFDVDSSAALQYANKQGGFPNTVIAETGKGYHYYVKQPSFEVGNATDTKLGLDIRGKGGYVVAPPSIHGNGNQYTWRQGHSVLEIDPAPSEPWMDAYLQANAAIIPILNTPPKPSKNVPTASKATDDNQYSDILKNGSQQGNRNHCAAKLIGHLLGKGNDESVVWEMIQQWNMNKNKPPLDYTELHNTFDSIRQLNQKNAKTKKETKQIDITEFLDTEERIAGEYNEEYIKVPFAGDLLSIMESKMNGGLLGGRMYIIGGIPSSCKTGLVNNMSDNICLNGHPVLFFSYDDGAAELRYRTFSRFSGFDIEDFNNHRVSDSDLKAIYRNDQVGSICKLKYVVQRMIKLDEWPQIVEKIKHRHKKAPVIIVDYLRKIKTDGNRYDERLRVDEIMSGLTELAKTHNLPVLVISELSRESYKAGQRLGMTSYKESGNIEYEASWLGILAAVEDDGYTLKNDWERIINHDGNIDLIVFKTKRGTGNTGRIALKLDKAKMTVRDRIEATKINSVTPLKRASKFD